jgi:tetratricopeptide (TPR) repeat protein
MADLLNSPKTWVFLLYLVVFFFLVTRAPELRVRRLRFGVSLILLAVFVILVANMHNEITLLFAAILIRPVLFVFGLIWSDVIGHHAGAMLDAATFGGNSGTPLEEKPSYRFERFCRDTGRYQFAIDALEKRFRKGRDEFEGLLLLASIYAKDLANLAKAEKIIGRILKSTDIHEGHKEYAAAELTRWKQPSAAETIEVPKDSPLITIAEPEAPLRPAQVRERAQQLRQEGRIGSAMELLKDLHRREPGDGECILLLAEMEAVDCGSYEVAREMVERLVASDAEAGLRERARRKLEEWRAKKFGADGRL